MRQRSLQLSEYDPVFDRRIPPSSDDDLDQVQELFEAAARPYLGSAWSWLAWALILPGVALLTPRIWAAWGWRGALLAWSAAVLAGGAIELALVRRRIRGRPPGGIVRWAFRAQGNLSLAAVALSFAVGLRAPGLAELLPGLWLLLLGHSFYVLGGLAFRPLRRAGLILQLGGLAAIAASSVSLQVFAAATAAANLWMAWSVRGLASTAGRRPGDPRP